MTRHKKSLKQEKFTLHPRNKHRCRYDFQQLIICSPSLADYVRLNTYSDLSIDFANPQAVKCLNRALLKHYYHIEHWDIPPHYLCPPIPGRADYIHYIADLLSSHNDGNIPMGDQIKCLDVGVGANCIYPIIGIFEYQWSFIGADIDPIAIKSANKIIASNSILKGKIELRLQARKNDIFRGMIKQGELIDITICNPPFHASLAEAQAGTLRKLNNLNRTRSNQTVLNFGGRNNELFCSGGEKVFIQEMIRQSKQFDTTTYWFTTLVSKKENLKAIYAELKKQSAVEIKTIPMSQGSKISRIVAWTFLSLEQQRIWVNSRWK